HRSHSTVRGHEACQSGSPENFHPLAGAWTFRPADRSDPWHDCRADQPIQTINPRHDRASSQPGADLHRTVTFHLPPYLHRASTALVRATVFAPRKANAICRLNAALRSIGVAFWRPARKPDLVGMRLV